MTKTNRDIFSHVTVIHVFIHDTFVCFLQGLSIILYIYVRVMLDLLSDN